jgi:hypothetical protein
MNPTLNWCLGGKSRCLVSGQTHLYRCICTDRRTPVAIKAARKAGLSGAFELAATYLDRLTQIWPYDEQEMWQQDEELTFDIAAVAAEISLVGQNASQYRKRVS